MLSNFQLEDHALLQSFLVGQPEFQRTMQSDHMLQLRQRVLASYHLGPMDSAETKAYIEHRLNHVGWKGDPRIEPSAYDLIHAESGGIPRRINTLCDRLLLAGFLADKHTINATDVETVVGEMHEEQGPSTVATSLAARQENVAANLALPQILSDPQALARLVDAGAGFHASRLEERIARLEQLLGIAIGLAVESGQADAAPEARKEGR